MCTLARGLAVALLLSFSSGCDHLCCVAAAGKKREREQNELGLEEGWAQHGFVLLIGMCDRRIKSNG
jgi:hypothetical protein